MISSHWLAIALLGCAALSCATRPASAQWRSQARIDSARVAAPGSSPIVLYPAVALQEKSPPRYGWMTTGGLIGGALGAVAGALTARSSGDIGTGVRNTSLGAAIGIPVGVHLGNRSRGDLLTAAAVSIGIGAAAFYAADPSDGDAVPILLAAPAIELVASILIEKATMPR